MRDMRNLKFVAVILAILVSLLAIFFVLMDEKTLIIHPKGVVAQNEKELIITNILLMLIIIIPTYILLFAVVYRYCIKKVNAKYNPDHTFGPIGEMLMWGIPSIVVIVMAVVTWDATHELNPYKPLKSETKPLTVQVVAMDWKWLFIYPELGIATLNYFHIPEHTPIHLKLAADGSPMNSFWIPQLSGQIYSMTGMSTQLYLMAENPGEYVGRAVEINGQGYADMTFRVKSSSLKDFEAWVSEVKKSPLRLTEDNYNELVQPSVNKSIILFSEVEKDLYHEIIHKYMSPSQTIL